MKRFYDCGIDLGTTNSCIAIPNKDNTCEVILSANQTVVTPSVVLIKPNGSTIVGLMAKTKMGLNPLDTAREFKRDMGTDTIYSFKKSGKQMSPIELSAEVLKEVKKPVEARMGHTIHNAIITVPAAFNMVQCEHTKKAASLAGFENTILLQEPIAAAIAYGAEPGAKEQYWLVFDYGGGTLDVSVISTKDDHLENVNSCGNNRMGGKDLDRILYEQIILPKLNEKFKISEKLATSIFPKLSMAIEKVKVDLSSLDTALFDTSDLQEVYDEEGEEIYFECAITRREFEQKIDQVISQAVSIAKKAVMDSQVKESEISRILLVGGTTFIPLVREKLSQEFNIKLDCSLNPMTVVAEGAALFAAMQTVENNVLKEDVCGEYILDFEYDPISSNDTENVCGKIRGNEAGVIKKIMIECIAEEEAESPLWSSGWNDLLDVETGAFDIDIKICNMNASNLYRISACNATGTIIPVIGFLFEIVHRESALKIAAPPMPYALGVEANDGTRNIVSWFTEKNIKLPVCVVKEFQLDRTLDPNVSEECFFSFYEGENTVNPKANHLVATVCIASQNLRRKIPKGTAVEIKMDIDISRTAHVSAYVPDYDIDLFVGKELGDLGGSVNPMRHMVEIEVEIPKTRQMLEKLKNAGVVLGSISMRFETVAEDYDKYMELIGVDNDGVMLYIQKFYDIQTEVIELEMEQGGIVKQKEVDDSVKRAVKNIAKYGNEDQKEQLSKLQEQANRMHDADSIQFVQNKIKDLATKVIMNSFDWLCEAFAIYEMGFVQYKDKKQAEYWKEKGREAINRNDAEALRNALFKLVNLSMSSERNEEIQDLAALRIM